MIRLKTFEDLAGIHASGMVNGGFFREIEPMIRPGVTTGQLDRFAAEFIGKHGGIPTFLGYKGFPGNICTSVNEQIVHGIPADRVLDDGDLLSIDVGVTLNGYVSDAARTYFVGEGAVPEDISRLMKFTRDSLYSGIGAMESGIPLRQVSRAIEQTLRAGRLGIIRELTGHGVGFVLHEEPTLYNYDPGGRFPLIEDGMVIAIEPMATLGSENILLGADNWVYSSMDGSLAAHFEHTAACWDGRPFILTDPDDDDSRQLFGTHG